MTGRRRALGATPTQALPTGYVISTCFSSDRAPSAVRFLDACCACCPDFAQGTRHLQHSLVPEHYEYQEQHLLKRREISPLDPMDRARRAPLAPCVPNPPPGTGTPSSPSIAISKPSGNTRSKQPTDSSAGTQCLRSAAASARRQPTAKAPAVPSSTGVHAASETAGQLPLGTPIKDT